MKTFIVALSSWLVLSSCVYRVCVTWSTRNSAVDPPSRVARVNYSSGTVSFRPAGTDSWMVIALNRPLTAGDELWVESNARAELDIGHAFVRLGPGTSVAILKLDEGGVQLRLSGGMAQVHLRRTDEQDEFEINTPQAAISMMRPGDYRVDVPAGGAETRLTVRRGEAEATIPGSVFTVTTARRARIHGIEADTYEIVSAPPPDAFDSFCANRDRRVERAESLQYVSPNVIGWEDLDEFGYWRMDAVYGWF
jgi:hypothetical protein